jgi:hypothetical protein
MTAHRKKSQLMELHMYCTVDMEESEDQFKKSPLLNDFWEIGWGRGKEGWSNPHAHIVE